MKRLHLLYYPLLCLSLFCSYTNLTWAQTDDERGATNRYSIDPFFGRAIPANEANKKIDLEDLNKQVKQISRDSTNVEKILARPVELIKLGVDPEYVQELTRLNELQDTLSFAEQAILEERRKEEGIELSDTLDFNLLNKIIEQQKLALIKKALALPSPTIYGHRFFRSSNLKLPTDNLLTNNRPPENYVLGTGDEINISLWGGDFQGGRGTINETHRIDDKGKIYTSEGELALRGYTYEQVKGIIKQLYSEKFDFTDDINQIAVSLNYTRVVSANFTGELLYPGSYKVPALTSIFNALVSISGPTQLGSMRHIEVKRNGKLLKSLDLYRFLLDSDGQQDFFLEENDFVNVPPLGEVVNISGEVRRPHNYELKQGEGLLDVVKFAGGLKAAAFTRTINIRRYENNREVMVQVNLDDLQKAGRDFPLLNGDSIFVYRVPLKLRDYIEVAGAVTAPGRYALQEGERISDALYKTQGVLENADLKRAYVIRLKDDLSKRIIPFNVQEVLANPNSPDNIVLQNLDTLKVIPKIGQAFPVKVSGAVQVPGEYEYAEGLTLSHLLSISGGLRREAANNRIEIARVINFSDNKEIDINGDNQIEVVQLDIGLDGYNSPTAQSFELKPYDHVFVRTAADFEEQQVVKLYGEVKFQGEYTLTAKDELLSNLLDRAGGLRRHAADKAARLYRAQDSIGYVLLDIEKTLQHPGKSEYDYILANGDSIYVPTIENIVTLKGAVATFDVDTLIQISVPYEEGKNAKYYIEKYGGGFGRFAKPRYTYVKQANGRVEKVNRLALFNKYPDVEKGAEIFVDVTKRKRNEELRRERREKRDITRIITTATTSVLGATTSILTIVLLLQQSNN